MIPLVDFDRRRTPDDDDDDDADDDDADDDANLDPMLAKEKTVRISKELFFVSALLFVWIKRRVTSDEISKKRHTQYHVVFTLRRSAITTRRRRRRKESLRPKKTTPTDSPVFSSRLPRWWFAFYIWQT